MDKLYEVADFYLKNLISLVFIGGIVFNQLAKGKLSMVYKVNKIV